MSVSTDTRELSEQHKMESMTELAGKELGLPQRHDSKKKINRGCCDSIVGTRGAANVIQNILTCSSQVVDT